MLSIAGLLGSDYEKSKHFYVDLLGFQIIRENYRAERDDYKIDLACGQQEIELFIIKNAPARVNYGLPIPPYAVYNIGNSHPENLLEFVDILQQELISAGVLPEDYDFDAHKKLVPMQPGDVPVTYADTTALEEDFGFKPQTSLREGLRKFAQWYAEFYK